MDFTTLIFFGLAVFIGWRLWSVLGETTGHEKPPEAPGMGRKRAEKQLPSAEIKQFPFDDSEEEVHSQNNWNGLVSPGSAQESGLLAIREIDPTFDARAFQEGAKAAYEMIVEAFAKGDRTVLKDFLAKDVYDSFDRVLVEREAHGEQVDTTFVSIDRADFSKVWVEGKSAFITLVFASKMITFTQDREERVIDGDPNAVITAYDAWTFSHVMGSRDPNWLLVETGEAQEKDLIKVKSY